MLPHGMLLGLLAAAPALHAAEPIPASEARAVFSEAQALCAAEGGRLWGVSLCGPVMLVDPKTRRIVASHADGEGRLQVRDGLHAGQLPADVNVANTAVEWSGTRWTQLLWPLPADPGERRTSIAHELFHRVQPQLPIARTSGSEGDNAHLDTPDGRYYLQLEWRALAKALQAEGEARRGAAADAVAFRMQRHRLFPNARRMEASLELNEGLAEYTGVVAGNATPSARTRAALRDLAMLVERDASFVRSFAYATGPAYGLLLDAYAPDWRTHLESAIGLGERLRDAAGLEPPAGDKALAAAAARYGGDALRAAESARERQRQAQLLRNRERFVVGPVLTLALEHMSVQFNPSNLQPLEGAGTVYPNLRIVDDWGTLEADGGALMKSDWSAVVVPAPGDPEAFPLRGAGWTLTLDDGWRLVPGSRRGDFVLARDATTAH